MARALLDAVAAAHTILTPNAELAAALSAAVERSQLRAGREIWPTPQIQDFGSWLRQEYFRRQLVDPSQPRCLTDIEEHEFWRSVVLESTQGSQFLEWSGAARAARRARRSLFEYGIPLSAIGSFPSEESLAFLDWNRSFETRCRDLNCISVDELLASAPPHAANVVWIENPLWRPQARRWLEQNAIGPLYPPRIDGAALRQVQAVSPEAEAASIAEWAAAHLKTTEDFRAWICIPDLGQRRSQVEDAFDAVLAPQRFLLTAELSASDYALAGGTPLARFAPVSAALDLLSAGSEILSFDQFSSLLRLPAMHAESREESDAALLDLELRERGPSEARLEEWVQLSESRVVHGLRTLPALNRLRAALRALGSLDGRQHLSRWVTLWVTALEAAPWSQRQRWSSTEFQAAERFRELLAALATADGLFGARSAASANALLRRASEDTAFQAQTGVPPIWVSGQLMDPWLTYDGVWIAGCSEGQWPPPVDPVPLLPVALQRKFNIVAAAVDSQFRVAEELQARFSARAPMAVFSCADPGDGRVTRPSPLLHATMQIHAPTVHPQRFRALQLAPRFESVLDERAPRFAAGESTRGVATLRAQSRCAFRGFAETRLRTAELHRPTPGFNPRERGELLHHALELVWAELHDHRTMVSTAPEVLDALLERGAIVAIARQRNRRDPGERWRGREQRRLTGLLAEWLRIERARAPFTVERLEQQSASRRYGGVEFDVRIDRVDVLTDGARVLIDYKTGSARPDWRGERPDNPQLPMYALLRPDGLMAVAYGVVNASKCAFVTESERGNVFSASQKRSNLEGLPTFSALLETWSRRIDSIAAEFAAGHAEVAPTARACLSCTLQPLCRVPSALDDDPETDVGDE